MIYIALLSRAAARFANHFFFFSRLSRTGMEFFLGFARDNDSPMLTYAAVLSVIESNNPDYTPGQLYIGSTVLAEYVVLNPKDVPSGLTRHDPTPGVPECWRGPRNRPRKPSRQDGARPFRRRGWHPRHRVARASAE